MSLISIDWNPDKQELRKFGRSMVIGFGLIGLAFMFWPWHWPISQNTNAAIGCWAFAGIAGALGFSGTRLALLVYLPWMAVAFVMGNVVSRVLVAAFFYGVITPMGLAMRIAGRDKLRLKKPKGETYWIERRPAPGRDSYERQF